MWIARLSPRAIRATIFCGFAFFLVLPAVLVRVIPAGLIRPLFFVASQLAIVTIMGLGLYGEGAKLVYDAIYRQKPNNKSYYIGAVFLALLIIPTTIWSASPTIAGLYLLFTGQATTRQYTAVVTNRATLFPFVTPDEISTAGGLTLTLPYPDAIAIGSNYTFTLLPNQNIVLSYHLTQ